MTDDSPGREPRAGSDLLREATLNSDHDLARNLLAGGARLDLSKTQNIRALFDVCRKNPDIFGLLLETIPDPASLRSPENWTLLHEASSGGCVQSIQLCLARGVDINARGGSGGYTPLHRAADGGRAPALRLLLESGADPMICGSGSEFSVLHSAAIADNPEIIGMLLATDAVLFVNTPDSPGKVGKTPLELAISFLRADNIAPLIDAGALVNRIGNNGDAPLHHVMRLAENPDVHGSQVNDQRLKVARALLQGGADIGKIKSAVIGDTPLHLAAKDAWAGEKMTALLLEYTGDSVDHQNAIHETPLHYAARDGKSDTVALLLKHGANPNAATKTNVTPLYAATCGNVLRTTELLLAAGADPDNKTVHNFLPEHYAQRDSISDAIKAARARKNARP